jgi:hypothetical protein
MWCHLVTAHNRSSIVDDQQALAIVSALANGANPLTGEMFTVDSPYQMPDVIRALFAAQRALEARLHTGRRAPSGAQSAQPRNTAGTNAGKPWSAEEDRQLLAAFDAEKPIAEIASAHGRTVGGVRARLEKHGRLEPSPATRWPQDRTGQDGANRSGRQPQESHQSRTA